MAVIVTYDIATKHVELKKAMFQSGYIEKVAYERRSIYLPNTTLYHQSKTANQAREDTKSVTTNLNVKLERCIATQWGPRLGRRFGRAF